MMGSWETDERETGANKRNGANKREQRARSRCARARIAIVPLPNRELVGKQSAAGLAKWWITG